MQKENPARQMTDLVTHLVSLSEAIERGRDMEVRPLKTLICRGADRQFHTAGHGHP